MLEGSILQRLKDDHRPGQVGKRPLHFGVYYKNTLVALCHALEDAILSADYNPLMITAFQRGKWYLQEAERYGAIAEKSQQIVIMAAAEAGFADHSTSQRSNVALVSLDAADPVAQEWHLIILSPDYTAMVLCQELSEADYGVEGQPQHDLERKFYGFWTFEPDLVLEAAELAIDHLGSYNPTLQSQLTEQIQRLKQRIADGTALCRQPTDHHLGRIVSSVVEYLQTSQQGLDAPTADYPLPSQNLTNNLTSNKLQAFLRFAQLIDQADVTNPTAAAEVATLAEAMGQILDLPAWQLHRLRLAGLLHRVTSLQAIESVLIPGTSTRYQEEQSSVPLSCSLVPGIQVLRRMPRLRAVATILTHQNEWWNGLGQPTGLAGDEIPVESRILGLVKDFQQRWARLRQAQFQAGQTAAEDSLAEALVECRSQQEERWDPKLVETLGILVSAMQQGLDLPVNLPKIAAGLWLIDSHSEETLLNYDQGVLKVKN